LKISIAKEALNRKISLIISKLNNEQRKKLVLCYMWALHLYWSEIKKIEAEIFGEL
jgi:hypothetical protein